MRIPSRSPSWVSERTLKSLHPTRRHGAWCFVRQCSQAWHGRGSMRQIEADPGAEEAPCGGIEAGPGAKEAPCGEIEATRKNFGLFWRGSVSVRGISADFEQKMARWSLRAVNFPAQTPFSTAQRSLRAKTALFSDSRTNVHSWHKTRKPNFYTR